MVGRNGDPLSGLVDLDGEVLEEGSRGWVAHRGMASHVVDYDLVLGHCDSLPMLMSLSGR